MANASSFVIPVYLFSNSSPSSAYTDFISFNLPSLLNLRNAVRFPSLTMSYHIASSSQFIPLTILPFPCSFMNNGIIAYPVSTLIATRITAIATHPKQGIIRFRVENEQQRLFSSLSNPKLIFRFPSLIYYPPRCQAYHQIHCKLEMPSYISPTDFYLLQIPLTTHPFQTNTLTNFLQRGERHQIRLLHLIPHRIISHSHISSTLVSRILSPWNDSL